jgi:Tol biopolymer transport system component
MLTAQQGPQAPQRLTDHAGDAAPAVNGDQVVFMSDRDGNWEIYRVQLDGSGLRRLTDRAAIDGLPVWSPDGQFIAFVSDEGGHWAVWSMRPDGSDRRLLFELGGAGLGPDWPRERISWGP